MSCSSNPNTASMQDQLLNTAKHCTPRLEYSPALARRSAKRNKSQRAKLWASKRHCPTDCAAPVTGRRHSATKDRPFEIETPHNCPAIYLQSRRDLAPAKATAHSHSTAHRVRSTFSAAPQSTTPGLAPEVAFGFPHPKDCGPRQKGVEPVISVMSRRINRDRVPTMYPQ